MYMYPSHGLNQYNTKYNKTANSKYLVYMRIKFLSCSAVKSVKRKKTHIRDSQANRYT